MERYEGKHMGRRIIVHCRQINHPDIAPNQHPWVVTYQVESKTPGGWLPERDVTEEGANSLEHGKELGFKYAKQLIENG